MTEQSLAAINERLKAILAQVDDPELPMDEVLALYEEAVKLGAKAGEAVERNITPEESRQAFADDHAVDAAAAAAQAEE